MKILPLFMCLFLLGCEVTPDPRDASLPELDFRVYYQRPQFAPPATDPIVTRRSIEANRCVYVATPFAVQANASDDGGISSIVIGPSAFFDALIARDVEDLDIFSLPTPSVATQTDAGGTSYANPGIPPGSDDVVIVSFRAGRAFDGVALFVTYGFSPGASVAALRATARNFSAAGGVSEVFDFFVRPATANPDEQPGMPCEARF